MPSGRSSITSIRNGYLFSPFTVDMKIRPAKSRAKANGSVQIVSMPTGYLKICDSRSCGDFFTVPYASMRDEQTQSISCPLCRSRFPFSLIMPRDLIDPRRLLTERRIVINHAHLGYLEYQVGKWSQPRGSPDSIRDQNIFDPHRQAPQEANGVDLRFIPEPIRVPGLLSGPVAGGWEDEPYLDRLI
jgi:hypothetical protein